MADRIVFVTGTDTGVGKTVVAAALAVDAAGAGREVCYFKPVQTGVEAGEFGDARFVGRVAGIRAEEGLRFAAPLAPAVAAAVEGHKIDTDELRGRAFDLAEECDTLLVEGAGGLLVLLSDGVDMADFAADLGAELVVATRPTLGTLNHTALTVEAARRRGLDPALVISNWPDRPGLTETTNLEQLREMAPVIGVVAAIEGLDVERGVIPRTPVVVGA